jgi:hypothetical protein
MPPKPAPFEKAVFTDPKKRDLRGRWALFVFLLVTLGIVYWVVRDLVFQGFVNRYAQRMFNDLASAAVEKIEDVDLRREGNVVLRRAEADTHHDGTRRLFFRTEQLRLTLDGMPLRDADPGDEGRPTSPRSTSAGRPTANGTSSGPSRRRPGRPRRPRFPEEASRFVPWHDPDEGFPRNGVYIHDGVVHVTFVEVGPGTHLSVHSVNGVLIRRAGSSSPLHGRPTAAG